MARIDGLPVILHDFEIVGPLARTVDDLAMALSAVEGPHPEDRLSFGFQPGSIEPVGKGKRVLYVPSLPGMPVDDAIANSCAAAADNLRKLGFVVDEARRLSMWHCSRNIGRPSDRRGSHGCCAIPNGRVASARPIPR